VLLGEKKNLYR